MAFFVIALLILDSIDEASEMVPIGIMIEFYEVFKCCKRPHREEKDVGEFDDILEQKKAPTKFGTLTVENLASKMLSGMLLKNKDNVEEGAVRATSQEGEEKPVSHVKNEANDKTS